MTNKAIFNMRNKALLQKNICLTILVYTCSFFIACEGAQEHLPTSGGENLDIEKLDIQKPYNYTLRYNPNAKYRIAAPEEIKRIKMKLKVELRKINNRLSDIPDLCLLLLASILGKI